jgi:hypothetical protein
MTELHDLRSAAVPAKPVRTRRHLRLTIASVLAAIMCATAWGLGAPAQAAQLAPAGARPAVTVSVPAATTHAAAAVGSRAAYVQTCGFTSCSVYLSRSDTSWLNWNIYLAGGGLTGLAASCGLFALASGPGAVAVAVACAGGIAVYGGAMLNAIYHAASDNGCLRVRYYPNLPGVFAFYDDHSRHCHDV